MEKIDSLIKHTAKSKRFLFSFLACTTLGCGSDPSDAAATSELAALERISHQQIGAVTQDWLRIVTTKEDIATSEKNFAAKSATMQNLNGFDGIAIVAHGLGNGWDRMQFVNRQLLDNNIAILSVRLLGHHHKGVDVDLTAVNLDGNTNSNNSGNEQEQKVTADYPVDCTTDEKICQESGSSKNFKPLFSTWGKQILLAVDYATQFMGNSNKKMVLVGFSTSNSVITDLMLQGKFAKDNKQRKFFFFAPPLRTTTGFDAVEFYRKFGAISHGPRHRARVGIMAHTGSLPPLHRFSFSPTQQHLGRIYYEALQGIARVKSGFKTSQDSPLLQENVQIYVGQQDAIVNYKLLQSSLPNNQWQITTYPNATHAQVIGVSDGAGSLKQPNALKDFARDVKQFLGK